MLVPKWFEDVISILNTIKFILIYYYKKYISAFVDL